MKTSSHIPAKYVVKSSVWTRHWKDTQKQFMRKKHKNVFVIYVVKIERVKEWQKLSMSADFLLRIPPMTFLGVQQCKVLLYILWEVIANMAKNCPKKPLQIPPIPVADMIFSCCLHSKIPKFHVRIFHFNLFKPFS